jgi:3-hydroxyisobutyrate dehydrogenase
MATVGFIGLGNMGGPMATNLVKAGHTVNGFDLNPASLEVLAKAGGHVAASAADAVKGASVVITMLPAGEHVRDVYLHQGGLIDVTKDAQPLLIDCSTIDVETARTVTATAETAGLAMLDAPVSGGTVGAQNGTLTFMVGGTDEAFARGKSVLEAMGKNIFHAGGPGAGQAVKICNNMMLAINMVGVSEGFLLAEKLGLDWGKLHEICATATALSIFQHLRERLAPFKRVRRLEFYELPKTISGKIRRVELRQIENRRAADGTRDPAEYREEDFPELNTK